jgi:hypothetical protein
MTPVMHVKAHKERQVEDIGCGVARRQRRFGSQAVE